jgi:DNA-directed RNA polymerase beta' subunit
MAQIKQLSNAIELTVKGSDRKIKVDFTDKRLVNKLLKLIKKYKNVEDLVKEKMKVLDEITESTVELIKSMGINIESKDEISDENIEKFLAEKVSEDKKADVKEAIADANMDMLIAASDIEIDILQDFKDEVNNAFNAPITDIMFGDTLPPLEYYVELFEAITPYIQKAKAAENKTLQAINEKYKLNNVVDFPERTEI